MWKVIKTNEFTRQYARLSSVLAKRTDRAVLEISTSSDPRKMGQHKAGRVKCHRAYKLDRAYRLLYTICDKERSILLVRVGTHKRVFH